MKRIARVFSIFILTMFGIYVAWATWHRHHMFYPTPETESAFLKNYSPKTVIERFQAPESSSQGHHGGGSAGREFVTHKAGFDWYIVIRPENRAPLMNALRDDAAEQLARYGACIVSQSGNLQEGFHFDYTLGNVAGSLKILPVKANSFVQRAAPLPKCLQDATVTIEQEEKWYPKA